jgi:hypothetical protein
VNDKELYDFDHAYAMLDEVREHTDSDIVAQSISDLAACMTTEVRINFAADETSTVSRAMLLVSGLIGGLIERYGDQVPTVIVSNIVALAGSMMMDKTPDTVPESWK